MTMQAVPPSTAQVWDWLAEVPDPEIPVVSVTDLGIIRDVRWQDGTLVVAVTPTYSGCPATEVIESDIREALELAGFRAPQTDRLPCRAQGGRFCSGQARWLRLASQP